MDQDSAPYISKKQKPNSELVHAEYTCKFYNKFSFKTMLVVIFLAALALFPFEIISQTGTWEVVQLILVGVAVSYGLFSRNAKTENEYIDSSKFDNVQSSLVEDSSFFENHQVSDDSRVETWKNYQYSSGKPLVVVAKESDDIISSRIVEKAPLVLPIRSLKSPVTEPISPKSSVSPPALIVKKSTLLKSSSIVTNGSSLRSVSFELRGKSAFKGKSVRTIRPFIGAARASFINGKTEDERNKEVDTQMQFMELSGEEKKDSDGYIEESSENVEEASKNVSDSGPKNVEEASKNVSDSGPENVDKKADEFIAKFREQIKLQRIQSTRISPGEPAKKLLQ